MDNRSNNNTMIWIVGIISIIALVLAWTAFNRSGENVLTEVEQGADEAMMEANQLGNQVEQTGSEVVTEAELALARAEARADLIAIEAELEAEQNYAEAVAEVQAVRTDLADAYSQTELEARQNWQEFDQELAQAEESLRTNSADALETLGGLILILEADVRTDQE